MPEPLAPIFISLSICFAVYPTLLFVAIRVVVKAMKETEGFIISMYIVVALCNEDTVLHLWFLDSEKSFLMGSMCLLSILISSKTTNLLESTSSSLTGVTSAGLSIVVTGILFSLFIMLVESRNYLS